MTTRKIAGKIVRHAEGQKAIERLSSRDRLMRIIGPQLAYATAPQAGETILFQRPDTVALATHKDWPQPLTAAARTLISEGDAALKTPDRITHYMDLMHRVVLSLARIEPPDLIEARARDEEDYEAARAAWRAEHEAALAAGDEARIQRSTADTPTPKNTHRDAALAGVDHADLRPLFVAYGQAADADQLILLAPGDGRVPTFERGEFKFQPNDLYSLMNQLMIFQAGGLITFRR